MLTINIGGKERPAKMKMLAVKIYRGLTGINIAGRDIRRFTDVVGHNADPAKGIEGKDFDPDLFIAFLYAVLVNGCHPEPPDFTIDDVGDWINLYDKKVTAQLVALYMEEMTGKKATELLDFIEKNQPAPESGAASGNSSGTTSSESPTGGSS